MGALLNRRRYMGGIPGPPLPETRLVCKYNITSTSSKTRFIASTTNVSAIEIDGVAQASVFNSYLFPSLGEHTVKFTLIDDTSLARETFNGIATLSYMYIPASVTTIAGLFLRGVTALETVVVDENNTVYDSRSNCNAIVETSTNTIICGCKGTTVPNGIVKIGDYSFQNNTGITDITISDTVTVIGQGAFRYCSNFASITVLATAPPTIGNLAFGNTSLSAIYVPSGSVETYKAASGWSSSSSLIQAIPT